MPRILYPEGVKPIDDDQMALALLGGEEKTENEKANAPAAKPMGRAFKPEQLEIHDTPFEQLPRAKYSPTQGPLLSTQKSPNLPSRKYAFEYKGVQMRSAPATTQKPTEVETKPSVAVIETRETNPAPAKKTGFWPANETQSSPLANAGKQSLFDKFNLFAKK